jgi:hypothetical protein
MLEMILNIVVSIPQVRRLLEVLQGEMTLPDKPNSRLQKYRLCRTK